MAEIVTFARLSWINLVRENFLRIDSRIDANITGVAPRKLNTSDAFIFCNNNISTPIPRIFIHIIDDKGKIINNPIYFISKILNSAIECNSIEQINNYSIICTSMAKNSSQPDLVYWDNDDEIIKNNNTIEINKVTILNGIQKNIILELHNKICASNTIISDIDVTGITFNKKTNCMLFGIGHVEINNKNKQQNIVISTVITRSNKIEIGNTFNFINKYDIPRLLCENNIHDGKASYLTDICFDDISNKLILLTACDDTTCGYLWTVNWLNRLDLYATTPELVHSKYDSKPLKFNQIPKGISKLKNKPNAFMVTFKYDQLLSSDREYFDYCIVELYE